MICVDREGYEVEQNETQNKVLVFLYETAVGRMILSGLVRPGVSVLIGKLLDSRASKCMIAPFIKSSRIDMSEFESRQYRSYNDFFTRKIKEGKRPVDNTVEHLTAPCDSRLSVYPIKRDARFCIKNTRYTMAELLRDRKLAARYEGGTLFVFRLSVDDYHRYGYVDDGIKSKNRRIPGVFHTVNPLANDVFPIYKENTREYSILKSENFGNILMMEVGALLVGKIVNYHQSGAVKRGEEKGRFEFGGSTVILAFEKDKILVDEDILVNSFRGMETKVKLGEKIGVRR